MKIRKLYGVGVGPGDPELLTLKAYNVLKSVDMIVAPRSGAGRRSLALLAIRNVIDARKEKPIIVEPLFPMTRDGDELRAHWRKVKSEVLERCGVSARRGCETIAFITLGDPSLYSTFYKFLRLIADEVDEVEVIPGVTSFSACSALAKCPVAEGDEIVSIVPDASGERAMQIIQNADSLVFLKPKNMHVIRDALGDERAVLCVKVGFEEQKLISGNLAEMRATYMSTLIVRKRSHDAANDAGKKMRRR